MKKQAPVEISQENDNYCICERCLNSTKASKQVNLVGKEIHMPYSKLPLYLYPANDDEKPVLIGYVKKCLNCHQDNKFQWMTNVPQRYNSQTIRKAFIKANETKYTKGLTEAEIYFPTAFQITRDYSTFFTYSEHYQNVMKQYTDMMRNRK